jgi:endonuclease III
MQRSSAEWFRDRLSLAFGEPRPPSCDPLEMLIATILSQNTTDVNRDRAYASLMRRFGSFDRVARAKEAEIATAIRSAGLQTQKARAIRDVLGRIQAATGKLDLRFLAEMTPEDAFSWLLASRGVGTKTASIVLLFSFGRPFFPVDTHIGRILRRVGLIPESGDAFRYASSVLPKDPALLLDLHLLFIQLGRTLCRPRRPACVSCPIVARCEHGRTAGAE